MSKSKQFDVPVSAMLEISKILEENEIENQILGPSEEKDEAVVIEVTFEKEDRDTIFELENGQRWKVLKGNMKLRKPMLSPDIIVVPGIAGRWFLQVDEDLPKARVYRID